MTLFDFLSLFPSYYFCVIVSSSGADELYSISQILNFSSSKKRYVKQAFLSASDGIFPVNLEVHLCD